MIKRKGAMGAEQAVATRPEAALPVLRDVLETHRLEVDNGAAADELAGWVREEHPEFDWKQYGYQEFGELLNYAQDKSVVRIEPHEEKGLMVFLGAEFHPPAVPEREPDAVSDEQPTGEHQPAVLVEIAATAPKPRRSRRRPASATGEHPVRRTSRAPRGTRPPRRTAKPPQSDVAPAE
jgi:hypothetical protein